MLVFELVFKALSRSKSFSLIFILNFTLAIAALSYLQFFKSSIDTSLETKAKNLSKPNKNDINKKKGSVCVNLF